MILEEHTQRCSCTISFTDYKRCSFYSLRAGRAFKAPRYFGPFLTASYNDRPCCVEIFKISLTVTEAKSNARTSCDGQAIKAIKIVETIG